MSKKVTTTVVTTTTTVTENIVPDNNKTHIICILDKSGSMDEVAKDAIGGFNRFLKDQKEAAGEATMSVTLFDNLYTPLYDGKSIPLDKVEELNERTFVPQGGTALRDAIGKTITRTKADFEKMDVADRPSKVLVLIVTDGDENSSREYSKDAIKNMIADQKKEDWQFLFLCSTEDAMDRASDMGVSRGNTFQFANTSSGNVRLYGNLSNATKLFRSATVGSVAYTASVDNLMDFAQEGIDDVNKIDLTKSGTITNDGTSTITVTTTDAIENNS